MSMEEPNCSAASTSFSDNKDLPRKISPPSVRGKKRHVRNNEHYYHSNKKHANGTNSYSNKRLKTEPMDLDPIFPKLNQSDPVHARRIQQRRKAIAIGKNTPGYHEYTKQVPKHKRKPRSMETPSTPDHTLDISNKRWQGMVKAWRRSLHQYDPPDLVSNLQEPQNSESPPSPPLEPATTKNKSDTIQSRQIEEAIAKGLLVDVTTPRKNHMHAMEGDDEAASFVSGLSLESPRRSDTIMDIVVEGEDADIVGDDDSDDDLL